MHALNRAKYQSQENYCRVADLNMFEGTAIVLATIHIGIARDV